MNDFENELRAGLRAAAADADTSGALAERLISGVAVAPARPDRPFVTPGWRGWVVPFAAAAVAAAVTVGLVVLVSHVRDASETPAGPVGPAVPSSASLSPAPSSSAPKLAAPSVKPSASTSTMLKGDGFRPVDVSFSTPEIGWAVGPWNCSVIGCTAVLRTTDGGASWQVVTAPPLDLQSCANVAPCAAIRSDDGLHAILYNYQGTSYQTDDGGKSWTALAGRTAALDMNVLPGTHVYGGILLTTLGSGCPPGCRYQVRYISPKEWTPATSSAWPTGLNGDAGQVVIAGQAIYVMTYQNPAGGSSNAQPTLVAYSANGGIVNRGNPCGSATGAAEVDATEMTAASNGDLSVLCVPRQQPSQNRETVVTSTDGGQHFSVPVAVPDGTTALGSADGSVLLASAGARLYRSAGTGRHWTQVASVSPDTAGADAAPELRMGSAAAGWWFPGYGTSVLTTADGGLTWTAHTVG